MPEGDTVWRTARRLDSALAGSTLTRTDFRVPRFATTDLAGRTVEQVVSRGKHLLIRVAAGDDDTDGWTVHSHLRMEGIWHVYDLGARWRLPGFRARLVLESATRQAVGFDLAMLEVVRRSREGQLVGHLGPDLLGADWDAAEASRRLMSMPDRAVGLALLDQRNLAGLGNVHRCELCFLIGMHPQTPIGVVPDVAALAGLAQRVIAANRDRGRRITTGDPREPLWVYGRAGRACLRCGTAIRWTRLGNDALDQRDLYWCPTCQPLLH